MKRCTKCGEEKPKAEFYARKAGKDGLSATCKACARAYHKAWRDSDPQRWHGYQKKHAGKQAQYTARLRERLGEDEWTRRQQRYGRTQYQRHPERKRAEAKRWRENNRELALANQTVANHRRRDQRAAMRTESATRDYVMVLRGDVCSYCHGPAGEVDHITPVDAGGTFVEANLTAACRSCNASKGALPLLTFLVVFLKR